MEVLNWLCAVELLRRSSFFDRFARPSPLNALFRADAFVANRAFAISGNQVGKGAINRNDVQPLAVTLLTEESLQTFLHGPSREAWEGIPRTWQDAIIVLCLG